MGGQIAPDRMSEQWFDAADQAAFCEEMEARHWAEMELPARGRGG